MKKPGRGPVFRWHAVDQPRSARAARVARRFGAVVPLVDE